MAEVGKRIADTRVLELDFLGYHFEKVTRWPRKKSLNKFKDTIRSQPGEAMVKA